MSRGQALLTSTALGIVVAVVAVQVLLSEHRDVLSTALQLGGAALLWIAAALFATAIPPQPARARSRR